MQDKHTLELLKQISSAIATQFGKNCEVVVHDLSKDSFENSVISIENGTVTGRKVGDGPSQVVLESLQSGDAVEDKYGYLTGTPDGKVLKSSTIVIRDEAGHPCAILGINFDITSMLLLDSSLQQLIAPSELDESEPKRISQNVNELLDDLLAQSMRLIGKPVQLMTKDDKINAIRFLNDHGAFLITKSGDKITKHFGISKYTLYSYIDAAYPKETSD